MSPSLLESLPFDLALRCVALLPLAEGPRYRSASRRQQVLGGAPLTRCRSRLGVSELRLVGAVTRDPRRSQHRRTVGNGCETACVNVALRPRAASTAKEMLQIRGAELEGFLDDVDHAAAALDRPRRGEDKTGSGSSPRTESTLSNWESQGFMSEVEAYAVLDGRLHLVGPPDLRGLRWMMRLQDAEEQFAQLQNARLYIAGVEAEYSPAEASESRTLAKSAGSAPGVPARIPARGVRGKLLFCALEA
mmetsp:Transcript_68242/g.121685  ORF Transcript_68242/g.121685 Transcript_68242/m.121685 type:complete len:248 (-) Transcript_68242:27-770(-)